MARKSATIVQQAAPRRLPDRLRLKARQRAAIDAEFTSYDPQDLVVLETVTKHRHMIETASLPS
jgi:hypothetical protein